MFTWRKDICFPFFFPPKKGIPSVPPCVLVPFVSQLAILKALEFPGVGTNEIYVKHVRGFDRKTVLSVSNNPGKKKNLVTVTKSRGRFRCACRQVIRKFELNWSTSVLTDLRSPCHPMILPMDN